MKRMLWSGHRMHLKPMLESHMDDRQRTPYPSSADGRPVVVLPVVAAGKVILHKRIMEGFPAKNLVHDVAKPDRHFVRIAGAEGVNELCWRLVTVAGGLCCGRLPAWGWCSRPSCI